MTGTLLRIFLCEGERQGSEPLYMAIIEDLQRNGFHGATVLKAIEGFGIRGHVRSARVIDFAADLPVLIEVIETEDKIHQVIPRLMEMIPEGLLTLEKIEYIPIRSAAN